MENIENTEISPLEISNIGKNKVIIIGQENIEITAAIERAVKEKELGVNVVAINDAEMAIERAVKEKELGANVVVINDAPKKETIFPITNPYLDIENIYLAEQGVPNKLSYLRSLNLSPEDVAKIINSPNEREEGELFENYKKRRNLRNLLIKYRNEI